jgi:hypothetical protein
LDNELDRELHSILVTGGLNLVRIGAAAALKQDGTLQDFRARAILRDACRFLTEIWRNTGWFDLPAGGLALAGDQEVPDSRDVLLAELNRLREGREFEAIHSQKGSAGPGAPGLESRIEGHSAFPENRHQRFSAKDSGPTRSNRAHDTSNAERECSTLRISGLDDAYFLTEPYSDGYTWCIHNDDPACSKNPLRGGGSVK